MRGVFTTPPSVCQRTGIGAVIADEANLALALLVLALALATAKGSSTAERGAAVLALVAHEAQAHAGVAHAIPAAVARAIVHDRRLLEARHFA